jgi:CRP-like cAMP-binding protein
VLDLVNRLSKHFALMSSRMNLLAGGTAYQRTAAALLYLGERMGDSLEGNGKIILNQIVTHRDLAAWCGSARETTSVNMKILERKGLISYNKRRIVINSIDKLLRESGE